MQIKEDEMENIEFTGIELEIVKALARLAMLLSQASMYNPIVLLQAALQLSMDTIDEVRGGSASV